MPTFVEESNIYTIQYDTYLTPPTVQHDTISRNAFPTEEIAESLRHAN